MPNIQSARFGFLFRPPAFIIGFVLLAVLNTLLAAATPTENDPVSIRLVSVFVYAVLGWFTYKRSRICTWVLCGLMILNGLSTMTVSFPALLANQGNSGMQLANLVAGGYFFYGGVSLFLNRPGGPGDNAGARTDED